MQQGTKFLLRTQDTGVLNAQLHTMACDIDTYYKE